MRLAYKVWLDQDGKVFGEGPLELLKGVDSTRSLRQACAQMGMSYSKAWSLIRRIEEKLGFALLERRVGGRAGGGSELTPMAKLLVEKYELFSADVRDAMARIYRKHFGSFEAEDAKGSREIGAGRVG